MAQFIPLSKKGMHESKIVQDSDYWNHFRVLTIALKVKMKKNRIVILRKWYSSSFWLKKGYSVYVSDNGIIKEKYKNILKTNKIDWEENSHNKKKLIDADLIIKSPGINNNNSIIKFLFKNKIPVISEIEFAYKNTNAKLICITGTNGKTTTSSLIYKILKDFDIMLD